MGELLDMIGKTCTRLMKFKLTNTKIGLTKIVDSVS